MVDAIVSVGYPGAGKSAISNLLPRTIPCFSMGDSIRNRFESSGNISEIVDDIETKEQSDIIGQWATYQKEQNGKDVVAKWSVSQIKDSVTENSLVYIDGLRSEEELTVFQSHFDNVTVIFVEASRSTRLERLKQRGRDGEKEFTMEDLEQRDKREDNWGLNDLKKHVDFTITNEDSLEQLQQEIERILNSIDY